MSKYHVSGTIFGSRTLQPSNKHGAFSVCPGGTGMSQTQPLPSQVHV